MKYLFFLLAITIVGCDSPEQNRNNQRLIYNNDGSEILFNNWFGKRKLTLADLHQYIDMVANSQVTTYMICSGSDFFYYRSKYGHIIGDDMGGSLNCGTDTGYYNNIHSLYKNAIALEEETGTDIVAASLQRAREKKLEAFITFRMNDLHFADTTGNCSIKYSKFWIQHPEYWTSDTTLSGWNARSALDFAHPEVRAYKLNIIKEQLEKYGSQIDGYELDFMRFIVYFKKADATNNAHLITDMVQEVRRMIDSTAKANNRKILLTARVPATINDCNEKGLNVRSWVEKNLLDFVTMGVHWRGEPAMGVAQFIKEGNINIPVYATMDDGGYDPREVWSHGVYRGMASHALAQGASGTNLFNYFLTIYNESNGRLQPVEGTDVCRTIAPELLQELGSLETLGQRNKIYSLSDGASSYGLTPNSPLPLLVEANATANIYVGDDVKNALPKEAFLFVRADMPDLLTVSLNGNQLTDADTANLKLYDKQRGLKKGQKVFCYKVSPEILQKGFNTIDFKTNKKTTIRRIELALKYGPVEAFGYF